MTISETYTAIGDAIRRQYGTTDKYSLGDMPKMIDSLKIHNLIDEGQYFDTTKGDSDHKNIQGIDLAGWNKLIGKNVTLSYDFEWSNYKFDSNINNRVTMEWGLYSDANIATWVSAGFHPQTSSGKKRISATIHIPNKKIVSVDEGSFFDQLNIGAVVKATNLKVVTNPLGVTRVNLLPNYEVRYLPQSNPANNFDCYVIYTDTSIKMEYGKKYEVIAETNGFFSNQHQPNVESNKCILWLTDGSVYTQPISDEHTAQGTVFTWGGPTGTYYLRVNAYHKSTTNTIYAYNVRIHNA